MRKRVNVDGISETKLEDILSTVISTSPDIFFLMETKYREKKLGLTSLFQDTSYLRLEDLILVVTGLVGVLLYTLKIQGDYWLKT